MRLAWVRLWWSRGNLGDGFHSYLFCLWFPGLPRPYLEANRQLMRPTGGDICAHIRVGVSHLTFRAANHGIPSSNHTIDEGSNSTAPAFLGYGKPIHRQTQTKTEGGSGLTLTSLPNSPSRRGSKKTKTKMFGTSLADWQTPGVQAVCFSSPGEHYALLGSVVSVTPSDDQIGRDKHNKLPKHGLTI